MLAIQYRNKFYKKILLPRVLIQFSPSLTSSHPPSLSPPPSLSLRFVLRNIVLESEILIRSQAHATVTYHLSPVRIQVCPVMTDQSRSHIHILLL